MLRPVQPQRAAHETRADLCRAPLMLPLVGLAVGILLDRLTAAPFAGYLVASLIGWPILLWAWAARRNKTTSALLLFATAMTGAAWHHLHWRWYAADELALAVGDSRQPAVVELLALHAPRPVPAQAPNPLQAVQSGERSRFEATAVSLRNARHWQPASGKLLVLVDGALDGIRAGDRLQVRGMLSVAEPSSNPGDVDFYFGARASRRLVLLRVDSPSAIEMIQRGGPRWSVRRGLDWLRTQGNALLWRHIDSRHAGLAAALLLGAREQLDRQTTDAFVQTNTIHLLAISGMHIAILAASLFYALRLGVLPRLWALAAVAAATALYTAVTDADPSAMRAMIVVLLVCLAMALGRSAAAFNAWAAGGLIVLAINPCDLFRAGPQLSFLAVAVMTWFWIRWSRQRQLDPLDELILRTRPWPQRLARSIIRWQVRMTFLSLVIWLVTMPIVGSQFHAVAPSAIVLSVLLSIPVGVALMSGFAAMLLGGFCAPLGDLAGWCCGMSLDVIHRVVHWAAEAPGSFFWFAGFPRWWIVGFYACLAALALWPRIDRRASAAVLLAWCLTGAAYCWRGETSDSLRTTFLSVGHGVAVVVQFPDGQTILYDAGRLGSPTVGSRSIAGYLWSQRIERLDAVVLSHADLDHYNALPELLKQFSVARVYVSPQMFREQIAPLELLRTAIEASGVQLKNLASGDSILLSPDAKLNVLHPPWHGVAGNDNAHSIVLTIEYAGRRILLTGDLESAGMQRLLGQLPYDCDIALAPHHGSARSDPQDFSAWCRPEWLVISGSAADDESGSLSALYQSRGAAVLHTARHGAVQFDIRGEQITATHWRHGRWHSVVPQPRASLEHSAGADVP